MPTSFEIRYLPIVLDISDTFSLLKRHLGDYHVEMHVVVAELLKSLFDVSPGRFGRNEGAVGAFIVMAPKQLSAVELRDVEIFLSEALKELCDEISTVLPHLSGNAHEKYYTFHGDKYFTFYQPVSAIDTPAEIYARALDANSVYNLVRGTR